MAMAPSEKRWVQLEQQKKTNQLIRDYIAKSDNMDYIDAFDVFIGPNGLPNPELFAADKLHNSPAGYKVRVAIVKPYLDKCPAARR